MPRLTLETKGGTWIRRFFLAHTRLACGLFGLVGVIVFRAFCAAWLPLFRLIQPRVAGQTEGGTVFRLVFPAAAVVARCNAGLVLKLTGVAFGTGCFQGATNHFVTGGADFTQCRIGWVGEGIWAGISGTIGGLVHALCRYKLIASGGSAIFVDV